MCKSCVTAWGHSWWAGNFCAFAGPGWQVGPQDKYLFLSFFISLIGRKDLNQEGKVVSLR
jgi:hypothetical protein